MTSEKQIRANKRNALKGTGKTPEGKAAIRLNTTKHGLLSQEVLLPGEDQGALKELDENLRTELQPVGELEKMLVAIVKFSSEAGLSPNGSLRIQRVEKHGFPAAR